MKIGIVGTGNTAWQLATHFSKASLFSEIHLLARNQDKGKELAEEFDLTFRILGADALDYYQGLFLCVSDEAIPNVSKLLADHCDWMVHTSGSVSLVSIAKKRKGVFYPLQTMTKGRYLKPSEIPLSLEASDSETFMELRNIADAMGFSWQEENSQDRLKMHLSAVFVNNFTNFLLEEASQLSEVSRLNPLRLNSLAKETVRKFYDLGGEKAQTGPARRGDDQIIDGHKAMLAANNNALDIYSLFSKMIKEKYG